MTAALPLARLAVVLLFCCVGLASAFTDPPIKFGMSCPCTSDPSLVPAALLGKAMRAGYEMAFNETNLLYGGIGGHEIQLVVKEDQYNSTITYMNTLALINSDQVLAVVGVIGAEQSRYAAAACQAGNTPLLGAYTGDYNLYNPFNRLYVNIRASYADEVNTLLSFMSNQLRLTRVSAYYQNESVEVAGFTNLTTAFNLLGLKLVSQGVYLKDDPVTVAKISIGVASVFDQGRAQPQAIACIGTFAQVGLFIKIWRNLPNCTYCKSTYFLMASFVGAELFTGFLKQQNISAEDGAGNSLMFVSQVVPFPNPLLSTQPIIQEYYRTGVQLIPGFQPSFTMLEGYIAGRVIVDTLNRIRQNSYSVARGDPWNLSPDLSGASISRLRTQFLDNLYNVTSTYQIGGLTLGPYSSRGSSACNQGLRAVYFTAVTDNPLTPYIPYSGDFIFPGVCGSKTADVARPLAFGQTANLQGDNGVMANKIRAGIQAAFASLNDDNGYNGRKYILISYDDAGDPALAIQNVQTLANENLAYGLMGSVGDDTIAAVAPLLPTLGPSSSAVPLIGAAATASEFRQPWDEYIINVRASVDDETTHLVNWMASGLRKYRVIVLYSNDTAGRSGYTALQNALQYFGVAPITSASYEPSSPDIPAAFATLKANLASANQVPEVIFIYGTHTPAAAFIELAHGEWSSASFLTSSSMSPEGLSAALATKSGVTNVDLYMSTVVPYPWDNTLPLVNAYLQDMAAASATADIGFGSLEGYITAMFASQVLNLVPASSNITGQQFVDAVYSRELFAFQGLRLGAFGNNNCNRNTLACRCNQGLHQVWLVKLNSSLKWEDTSESIVWSDCQASKTVIGVPTVFGTILPYGEDPVVSRAIADGIQSAFDKIRADSGLNLTLLPFDFNARPLDEILDDLVYNHNVFALVGLSSNALTVAPAAAERNIPSIGSVSGSSALREPYNRLYVNIRTSIQDDAGAAMNFAFSRNVLAVTVIYDENLGSDPVTGVNRAAVFLSMTADFTSYNPSVSTPQSLVDRLGEPTFVLMFGSEEFLAEFVELAKQQRSASIVYMAVGLRDPDYFMSLLGQSGKRAIDTSNVYTTSVVPPVGSTTNTLVNEYVQSSIGNITAAGLEGYLAGKLIGEVLKRSESGVSRDAFLSSLYNFAVFNLSGVRVGPYGAECADASCYCNQGLRQVWVTGADGNEVPDSTFEFSGCGVSYSTDSSGSDGVNVGAIVGGIVGGVLGLLFILAIIAALLFFLFYRNYRKREKELAYALQNTPLSMLENSLIEMETEMAQMTPFDGENSILYQVNDAMFPIHLAKTFLDFGVDPHKQCPINTVLTDTLTLENTSKERVEFRFHHALRNHKMSLLFTPNHGFLKPGRVKDIKVELVMKITTTISEPVIIEAVEHGHVILNVKKESELSTMLDYEEITINGPPIGVGGFGKVFRGHWRGAEVAVKVLRDQNPHIKELTQFKNEIEMVNKLRHKNIVGFLGAVTVPGKMCMVSEYIKLGSLQAAIHSHKKMSKLVKAKVALDVANGMNFLHQSGILHRDLKPDNVLIVSLSGKADINAKLTDFGTSRAVGAGSEDFTFTKGLGTPIYMAPEILGHQDYSEKADVYSFAIMLWALVAGKEPYSDFKNSWDIARFVTAGKRLEVPKSAGALMTHLITACWAHNPDERPSFEEISQELQSYVTVKKYGTDDGSGDPTEGTDAASSYGFGSRANESRGLSKNSGGKSSRNTTRNNTKNSSNGGSSGPPSKNTSAYNFGGPTSRNTTKEGYAAGVPAPPGAADGSSDDDSSDDSSESENNKKLKSKLKKAGKNVTWDENKS